eukprot:gene22198-29258_t
MAWGDPAATPSAACPLGSLITPTSSIDPAAAAALESVASAASQLEERLNSHAMAGKTAYTRPFPYHPAAPSPNPVHIHSCTRITPTRFLDPDPGPAPVLESVASSASQLEEPWNSLVMAGPAPALESVASSASQLEEPWNSHAMAGPRGSSGTAGALASVISAADDAASQAARISRLGAEATLRACAVLFGTTLWSQLPSLWDLSSKPVAALAAALGDAATNPTMATDLGLAQAAVNALQLPSLWGLSSKAVAALAVALGDVATNPTMATDLGLAEAAVNAL